MRDALRKSDDDAGGAPPRTGSTKPKVEDSELGPAEKRRAPTPPSEPTRQFADLVLARVDPTKLAALQALLEEVNLHTKEQMRGDRYALKLSPFHTIEGLHYARFVLLGAGSVAGRQEDVFTGDPLLAFTTDYDGPEGKPDCSEDDARALHQRELARHELFERVFSHCRGYRAGELLRFMNAHRLKANTRFVAAPGRSVGQILWEAELHRKAQTALPKLQKPDSTPESIRQEMREQLKAQAAGDEVPWFPAQPDLEARLTRLKWAAGALVAAMVVGLWLALRGPLGLSGLAGFATVCMGVLALALTAVARFAYLERNDPQFQPTLNEDTHEQLAINAAEENEFLQNQLTHVVRIKRGPLRWLLIRVVFYVLQKLVDYQFNKGKLGDIPSIHFARWALGPDRSVIFFSNFDSSWQSYLGDFIDKASSGLTAVWSNTERYPRSAWLTRAGSRDAQRFLAWTRYHQRPTQVWYSAYPGLSVVNINANTELRRGLARPPADAEPRALVDAVSWLSRLRNVDRREIDERYGAEQARETPLNLDDIQGMILKGYGHKEEARYLLLTVGDAAQARRWLAGLKITSVNAGTRDKAAPDPLLNVAFTYRGLKALQVEPELCDAFSSAFVQGSLHPDRLRVNHDVHTDGPEHWHWGGQHAQVHIALLIFATRANIERVAHEQLELAEQHGLSKVAVLEATTLKRRAEHFGFRDGIAQPIIKGSGDPGTNENTIAAGEILLGHRDGYGNVSHAPVSREGFRFGFNGSYMVLRQLEQDVRAFWRNCSENAQQTKLKPIEVASKMVGRWPSGKPLVRWPDKDPEPERVSNDDAFGYFEAGSDNDRYGGRCPFGAHIRRSNPRDWGLGASSEESTRLSNLHRIMRRGRPYGKPLEAELNVDRMCELALVPPAQDEPGRGLQFICFNADIERQFEFIQQQWCKNPKFAGQHCDADPLLGPSQLQNAIGLHDPGLTLQCDPHSPHTQRLAASMQPFVRLRGSAYLFMPSLSALKLLPHVLAVGEDRGVAARYEQIPDDEQLHTERLIDNIRKLVQKRDVGTQTTRDAHPKMHGLVRAVLEVEKDVPEELRRGIFVPGSSYKAWVRFSNQDQNPRDDIKPDTRGLALKLLNVSGPKLLDGEEDDPCQDFIFLSTPTFVARDVAEFDELINATVNGDVGSWLRSVRTVLRHLRSRKRYGSPLDASYFSVVPSLIGEQAVKYVVEPSEQRKTPLPAQPAPRNFLRQRLKEQLSEREYVFDVKVLNFVDQRRTPIEDPTVRWRGEPITIARLRILKQEGFDTPERDEWGEKFAFNPFRCLAEHRPLGGINRARRQVYRALATFRHNRNGVKPFKTPEW